MSETTTQMPAPTTAAEAKAAAKAAKAYAKSLRPWYKKKRFIVPGALVALVVVISMASGGGSDSPTTGGGAAQVASAEAVAIGAPVRDGDFEFVVHGVESGVAGIGNDYFGTTAQGQFIVVDLSVTNIANEPQWFMLDYATLYNAEGQKFAASGEAMFYLEDGASILDEINPGNTLRGKVVFDVPASVTPVTIELQDSLFSGGAVVNLA